jgi:hypothetical protein
MSKSCEEIEPNYAPIYAAALYPELARIFVDHGWALAVHGSLRRDFDLIAVPWIAAVSEPEVILTEITSKFWIRIIGQPKITLEKLLWR